MNSFKNILKFIVLSCLLSAVLVACNDQQEIYLLIGHEADKTEQLTAKHLKTDIEKVLGKTVHIVSENEDLTSSGRIFVLGTPVSSQTISALAEKENIILSENFPGSRGGIWATVKQNKKNMIVLAGSDVQGMQYAVYQYCKDILDVDPFEYWTGRTPKPVKDIFNIPNKLISPPEIPILCYFENDVDELANIKKPMLEYDWENYTQMINSLVRIKYNAIQLFDMLGRPEFFLRPEYQAIRPDYEIRISYIDSMINYAQDMGMKVQIDMALGYKIKPMAQEKADCWAKNKQEWLATWKYYLEETPLGKTDIFVLRPRNQVWDWEYKSSCGENKIDVFNEVYAEFGDLIDEYQPGATKIVICYHDGMEMFNNGFNPPKDWIVAWSDDGWCGFDYLPNAIKGYDFGTYMHAGFWLNHTVHDPCPVQIETIMKQMVNNYGANKYCMVNGQQFRPFLLNLEAFSALADAPNSFDGEQFYTNWTNYYFGMEAAKYAKASMKKLHEAQYDKTGYVQHLWEIREAVSYLSNSPIERPGKSPVPHEYTRVENDLTSVKNRIIILNKALKEAENGLKLSDEKDTFYHDYVYLPIKIYSELLVFESLLHDMAKSKKQFEETGNVEHLDSAINKLPMARDALKTIYRTRENGDKNPKWKGWYFIENRRPNNGFPTMEMLNGIESSLRKLNMSAL